MPRTALMCTALFLLACGPQEGDACEPGTPPVPAEPEDCNFPLSSSCGLTCAGPPGCEGEVDFHWVYSTEATFTTWCGCDGVTGWPALDYGSLPNTRWRHYGSCESPCAEVTYRRGWLTREGLDLTPVAPECTRCADGVLVGRYDCQRPDGFELPFRCCDCTDAVSSEDGRCVWEPDPELELAAFCCE